MRPVLALAMAAVLAACSTLRPESAPGCHGARRSANPHGSVLAPAAPSAAPSTPPAPTTGGQCGRPRP